MKKDIVKDHHVVIIGGGFGGLYCAKKLGDTPFKVTLIDKRNYHLFQPLLYQVASGWLSPGDITSPLRGILNRYKNITVFKAEVIGIEPQDKRVVLADGKIGYDSLILATGSTQHYFGNDNWAELAPTLKTVEDSLRIRKKILLSFEQAEREDDLKNIEELLTFIIVGGGPTGVELAGTIGELANTTLKNDFRNIDTRKTKIYLIEGLNRILPTYPDDLSNKAKKSLHKLGVDILESTMVTEVCKNEVKIETNDQLRQINARTILWTAGVKASKLGYILSSKTGVEIDHVGRVMVSSYLNIPGFPDIFVIGDLAHLSDGGGEPLPGVAPVAMQQGDFVAKLLKNQLNGKETKTFKYANKGNLAVIGRNSAVADLGRLKFSGFLAWLIWVFIHIGYLIEFDNKIMVLFQWASNYFTRKRGTRLITEEESYILINNKKNKL